MQPDLIPAPLDYMAQEGQFSKYANYRWRGEALALAMLPTELRTLVSSYQRADGDPAIIEIRHDALLGLEGYEIKIQSGLMILSAASRAGLCRACATLKQLFSSAQLQLDLCEIKDAPALGYRGVMLDVSRHFRDVSFIKRFIDLIADHKFNVFQWHLTDDQGWRIEIAGYPELTRVGACRNGTVVEHTLNPNAEMDANSHSGFYTQAEIAEVIAYADERCVTVVPEFNVPGHVSALLAAYPELGCRHVGGDYFTQPRFGIFNDVLCAKDTTLHHVKAIFKQFLDLFPAPLVHIGGDEVKTEHWCNCSDCAAVMEREGFTDATQLQGYFVKTLQSLAREKGKQVIGWDEVLEGDVDNSTLIMSWRGEEGGIAAVKAGHSVVMCPVSHVYLDFYDTDALDTAPRIHGLTPLSKTYSYQPIPASLSATESLMIKGAQVQVWCEYLSANEDVERAMLPRLCSLAEVMWTGEQRPGWTDFSTRMVSHENRLYSSGYAVSDAWHKPIITLSVQDTQHATVNMVVEHPEYQIVYRLNQQAEQTYEGAFTIAAASRIEAWAVHAITGERKGPALKTWQPHKAIHAQLRCAFQPDTGVSEEGAQLLVNGERAQGRIFFHHEWAAFDHQGADITLELACEQWVSRFETNTQASLHRRLFVPNDISIELSLDSINWHLVAQSRVKQDGHIELEWPRQKARYIRIRANNNNRDYSFENKRQQSVPIYFDELVIQ